MRYAILDAQGVVLNIVVADASWQPGDGLTKREATPGCEIGGRWTGSGWEPAAPPLPTQAEYQAAIEAHVEATAKARSYSSAVSCASYLNSTVTAWAAEAAAFVSWRDQVWLEVYETLAAVQGGAPAPTIAELVAGLPAIGWPA